MSDLLKMIGEKVREARIRKGLSQENLAEKSNLHSTYRVNRPFEMLGLIYGGLPLNKKGLPVTEW